MNFNLLGLGAYLPASVFTNDDMAKIVETNHEWIHSRSGIASRRFVTEENTHDLAIHAARSALKDAKLDATQIDAILVATFTPTAVTPSVACMVADGLGCREDVLAFDLNGACTGFIYGLETAYGLLHNPTYQNILVIGAEVISKVLDFSDRRTCILFGDGAGAAVVSSTGTGQKLWSKAYRKQDIKNSLYAPGNPVKNPLVSHPSLPQVVAMDGTSVFQFACEAILETIRQFSAETGLALDDIDHVVLHQANQRIINNIAKTHKQNNAKFVSVIEEMGNTSAASIAIAMTRLKEENRLLPGQTVLMIGFGAGLTYGAFALRM